MTMGENDRRSGRHEKHVLRAVTAALLAAAGLGVSMPGPALAQQVAAERSFDIPAQPLATALQSFGQQAGLQVSAPAPLLEGRVSTVVKGALPSMQALSQLLVGTGLTFRVVGSTVTLEPAPQSSDAVRLGPVRVAGTVDGHADGLSSDPGATEGTGSYAAHVVTIGKEPLSLRETPQSITVMTRKLMEDQHLDTVSDLLLRTPGIVFTTDSNARDVVYSRGFPIRNIQLDGVSIAYDGDSRPNADLAMYDRVEILRGSDGLFSGTGQPGGTVNLVRKRPLKTPRFAGAVSAGSWNNYRLEADATGPLAVEGRLRGRFVAVYQNRDFFYAPAEEEKTLFYGVVEADLGEATTVSVGANHQVQKGATWYMGLPRYADGGDLGLPRKAALTTDWAVRDQTTYEYFGSVEHAFGEDWTLKVKASHQDFAADNMMFSVQGMVDRNDPLLTNVGATKLLAGNKATTVDINLTGGFDLFGRRHRLILGADWQESHGVDMRYYATAAGFPTSVDIFNFDRTIFPEPVQGGKNSGWPAFGAKQMGAYAKLQMQVGPDLKLVAGGRLSNYTYSSIYEEYAPDGSLDYSETSLRYRERGIFTPYGGLVYDVSGEWSLYGSVAEIYQPQSSLLEGPPPGTPLPPITGRNYEVGVKGALNGGRLNLSLAFYRAERNGEARDDFDYPYVPGELGRSCCYIASGKVVSQGVDIEISGEIAPGWQVLFGYTYNHNRDKETDLAYHAVTPRHLLKLWSSYTLRGQLSAWTVGAGLTAQSKQHSSGAAWANIPGTGWVQLPYRVDQKGYAVANASGDYRISSRLSLALNVNNLFDKRYYQTVGTTGYGNWYGEPRSFVVTLRGGF